MEKTSYITKLMSPLLKIYLQSCDLTSHIHGVKNKFSVKELGNKMEKELRNEIEKKTTGVI